MCPTVLNRKVTFVFFFFLHLGLCSRHSNFESQPCLQFAEGWKPGTDPDCDRYFVEAICLLDHSISGLKTKSVYCSYFLEDKVNQSVLPNRRLGHDCHSQWKDLWEACWRWGRREVWTNFIFLGSLKNIFLFSESSQLWVGPRTLSSAELAWWPGIPMDRFLFKQFFFVFKFFFPFQMFSCIFFPYQVERTTFFEGTDVEFAQLSEEVIWMLVAIVFAL